MLGDHFMIQKGVPWKQSVGIPLAVRLPGAAPVGETPHRLKFPTLQQLYSIMQDWMHSGCSAEAGQRITILFRAVRCCRCCAGNKSASVIFALAKATLPRSVSTAFPSLQHHIGAAQTAAEAMRGRLSSRRTASTSNISAISWGKRRRRNSTICNAIRRSAKTALQMKLIAIRSNRHAAGCRTWWIIIRRRRKRGQLPVRQIARRRRTKGVIMCRVFVFW